MKTTRITGILPAATLDQRLAGMSITSLMFAARELASRPESDAICTAVLERIEAQIPADTFEAFVAEIFA